MHTSKLKNLLIFIESQLKAYKIILSLLFSSYNSLVLVSSFISSLVVISSLLNFFTFVHLILMRIKFVKIYKTTFLFIIPYSSILSKFKKKRDKCLASFYLLYYIYGDSAALIIT